MKFFWPEALWLFGLLPLLVLAYVWLQGRRRRATLHYPALSLVSQALGKSSWKRHIPVTLILSATACLVVATARPSASVLLPSQRLTVMMVMDVSGSMGAEDVAPNRLSASQIAAKAFVAELPPTVRVGVVAYGGSAHLVQAPTLNRHDIVASIDHFKLQPGTAIGSGILVALATLFPGSGIDVSQFDRRTIGSRGRLEPGTDIENDAAPTRPRAAPGSHKSAAIVVLTDGQNTTGPSPLQAAMAAADHGIKVFTVGFGSVKGITVNFRGFSMRVFLDEDTLRQVAGVTGAEYFHAGTGQDLSRVYEALQSRLVFEETETEVTALLAGAGALLMLLGVGLSVWWFGRVS